MIIHCPLNFVVTGDCGSETIRNLPNTFNQPKETVLIDLLHFIGPHLLRQHLPNVPQTRNESPAS